MSGEHMLFEKDLNALQRKFFLRNLEPSLRCWVLGLLTVYKIGLL